MFAGHALSSPGSAKYLVECYSNLSPPEFLAFLLQLFLLLMNLCLEVQLGSGSLNKVIVGYLLFGHIKLLFQLTLKMLPPWFP